MQSRNPCNPAEVVADFESVPDHEVVAAFVRARKAQAEWAARSPRERSSSLIALAEEVSTAAPRLVDLVITEVGKPRGEARAEVQRSVEAIEYLAHQAFSATGQTLPSSTGVASLVFTQLRPCGVAALITPWNFPVAIPCWKATPALAAGNAVIWKPAPESTGTALALGELFDAVLPRNLVQVLPGGRETGLAVLAEADVVSFTGSVPVGREISTYCAGRNVPVQAELGGHNASVVLADADVALAARSIAGAAMSFAGQRCTATRRAIVLGSSQAFLTALEQAVAEMSVGDPGLDSTMIGPVISSRALEMFEARLARAEAEGGRVRRHPSALPCSGHFAPPTIVDSLPADSALLREEVFAPLCLVSEVADVAEAAALVNDTPYGLATAIYGQSMEEILPLVQQVNTGLIRVNAPSTGIEPYFPFGGTRASAYGPPELGPEAYTFYCRQHTVLMEPSVTR